jgi:hypothetical protein
MDSEPYQTRVWTQHPGEQGQSVEQRARHEAAVGEGEGGVDRVDANVDVDPVDAGSKQLEQSVGSPEGARERVRRR